MSAETRAKALPARRVCGALMERLQGEALPAALHSAFQGAANLSTPAGLVTLLTPGRCLQPWSILLGEGTDLRGLAPGGMVLDRTGLRGPGGALVTLAGARAVPLSLPEGSAPLPELGEPIRAFLAEAGPDTGLCALVLGGGESPYVPFLAPRLAALRGALRRGDGTGAVRAAGGMAGCGPGLTPSSDDLLCGLLAVLRAAGAPRVLVADMARAAAARTNDISASLLLRAGEGLFSEDVLRLLSALRGEPGAPELARCLERVAAFGSSSGRDFLTGVYLGMEDAHVMGGMQFW